MPKHISEHSAQLVSEIIKIVALSYLVSALQFFQFCVSVRTRGLQGISVCMSRSSRKERLAATSSSLNGLRLHFSAGRACALDDLVGPKVVTLGCECSNCGQEGTNGL